MDELMMLPKDLIVSEIFGKLDKPEIHILGAASKALKKFTEGPEFLEAHFRRQKSPVWLYTHYVTKQYFHFGVLSCTRVDDLKELTFILDKLLAKWMELGAEIKILGSDGTLVVFLLQPDTSFLVLNPFTEQVYHIKCPLGVFTEEWFWEPYIVDIIQQKDDFAITFLELVQGVPQYLELTGKEQKWTRREVSFVENLSSVGDEKCFTIAAEYSRIIYKVFLGNEGKELLYIKRTFGTEHLMAVLPQELLILPEESIPGWITGWFCVNSCNGWCILYQTINDSENELIGRLRKLFLFKIRDGVREGDLFSNLDTESLMPNMDYEIVNVSMREIQGDIYISFQTNPNTEGAIQAVTTVFKYDVGKQLWRVKRISDINCIEVQKPVYTSGMSVYNKDSKIIWSPMAALTILQRQENDDLKMKYLKKSITAQIMKCQPSTEIKVLHNDAGFEYSEEEPEEQDVDIENQYYNSKGLVETDPEGALTGFAEVIQIEPEKTEWGFKALKQTVKLYHRLGRYKEMMNAYMEMLTYVKSAVTRSYSEKCLNNIMDFVSGSASQNFNLQEFCETTLKALEGAKNERLWFKTNFKLCKISFDMGKYGRMKKILNELHKSCQQADGTDYQKKGTQLLEVYAMEIQMYTKTKNNKKLKELYQKALTIKSAIPHPRIKGIIHECGGQMHMAERQWPEAATAFFKAFKNYDEARNQRRIQCLKYLVFAYMLMQSEVNPFDGQEAKAYKNDPEILAMANLIAAYQCNEILEFENILKGTMVDPFISKYIEDLMKNIRTQVLLKLIKPYTRIRIPFISKELNVPEADVEELLVSLILDNRVQGHIDQVNRLLECGDRSKGTKKYNAVEKWNTQLRSLYQNVCNRVG